MIEGRNLYTGGKHKVTDVWLVISSIFLVSQSKTILGFSDPER